MRSVSTTTSKKIKLLSIFWGCIFSVATGQNINSPYSRYGLGDNLGGMNILNRGMGHVSGAYADYTTINFINPASYSKLLYTTFDLGLELDTRTIRADDPPRKHTNTSPILSYIQLGFPIKKSGGWGVVLGLRPLTRITYDITKAERLVSGTINDSIQTVFQGSGGTQQVYVGSGYSIGNLSFGINAGFLFGSKDYNSRRIFINDTVPYYKSNHSTTSNFNGIFLTGGLQYSIKFSENTRVHLGVFGNMQQDAKGTKTIKRETYNYDESVGDFTIDSVYGESEDGEVKLPASFGGGIIFHRMGRFQFGVDYVVSKWSEYLFFGETDQVQDSWQLNTGFQTIPQGGGTYWTNVSFRGGAWFGQDYVNAGGDLPRWGISFGMGLPMRKPNYSNQVSVINTSFEYGRRGTSNNPVRENYFRFALGLSLSDIWFLKRKYD